MIPQSPKNNGHFHKYKSNQKIGQAYFYSNIAAYPHPFIQILRTQSSSTMSDGNAKRSYKVFEKLYYRLIKYPENRLGRRPEYKIVDEIKGKLIKLIDSTTMSLCLTLFFHRQNFGQPKEVSKPMFLWMKRRWYPIWC